MSSLVTENENSAEQNDWIQPITKENLGERAYLSLRSALMGGQFRPGERFLLRQMSKRFGISATPMREALLRLVGERALTMDGRGTVITPSLTKSQLLEIRTLRVHLEGLGAAEASQKAKDSDIDKLEELHAQIADCHTRQDFATAINLNTEFHLMLSSLSGMTTLYELVEGLWVRCGPILSHLYDEGMPDWDPHPHLSVIKALRDRDATAAKEAIVRDIEFGGAGLLHHVADAESTK